MIVALGSLLGKKDRHASLDPTYCPQPSQVKVTLGTLDIENLGRKKLELPLLRPSFPLSALIC